MYICTITYSLQFTIIFSVSMYKLLYLMKKLLSSYYLNIFPGYINIQLLINFVSIFKKVFNEYMYCFLYLMFSPSLYQNIQEYNIKNHNGQVFNPLFFVLQKMKKFCGFFSVKLIDFLKS